MIKWLLQKNYYCFGVGAGFSYLLSGLKLFPLDVTTIIAVSDNGSSIGVLKERFGIAAIRIFNGGVPTTGRILEEYWI